MSSVSFVLPWDGRGCNVVGDDGMGWDWSAVLCCAVLVQELHRAERTIVAADLRALLSVCRLSERRWSFTKMRARWNSVVEVEDEGGLRWRT